MRRRCARSKGDFYDEDSAAPEITPEQNCRAALAVLRWAKRTPDVTVKEAREMCARLGLDLPAAKTCSPPTVMEGAAAR
jgi:hypothetical protein